VDADLVSETERVGASTSASSVSPSTSDEVGLATSVVVMLAVVTTSIAPRAAWEAYVTRCGLPANHDERKPREQAVAWLWEKAKLEPCY
jgi:hypothetical protein